MSKYAQQNNGVAFVLVVMDLLFKFLSMRPLQSKKGQTVTSAFEKNLREGRRPTRIRTDMGQGFRSRVFYTFLTTKISSTYTLKANYAESVISIRKNVEKTLVYSIQTEITLCG